MPQPPALTPLSTARTAGRSDQAERRFRRQPFILLSFSSSEKLRKRRKRSHTNVSNTLVTRPSTPSAQTPQRSFQKAAAGTHATPAPNRAHSGSQGETGAFWMGRYHYPRSVPHIRKPPRAGCQNGKLCRFTHGGEACVKELPSASRVGLSHQPCLHPASRSGFV